MIAERKKADNYLLLTGHFLNYHGNNIVLATDYPRLPGLDPVACCIFCVVCGW